MYNKTFAATKNVSNWIYCSAIKLVANTWEKWLPAIVLLIYKHIIFSI